MRDTVTTSWRRLSGRLQQHSVSRNPRGGQALPVRAPQLETWENEGGQFAHLVTPVRILIVDDDIPSASSLELMLHASGCSETRVAYSGHAALAIAAVFQPSVVLLELRLLDMSGHEVARLLRERAQTHDLRLIALMSSREHAGRALARMAEFERYLLNPVAALDLSGLLQMEGAAHHCSQRESRSRCLRRSPVRGCGSLQEGAPVPAPISPVRCCCPVQQHRTL